MQGYELAPKGRPEGLRRALPGVKCIASVRSRSIAGQPFIGAQTLAAVRTLGLDLSADEVIG